MLPWIASESIQLGPIPLRTWGMFVAMGYFLGSWLAARRAIRQGLNPTVVWDLAFWLFIAAFVGARLFHLLAYNPASFLAHPLAALDPRQPGFAIYGAFIACILTFFWFIRKRRLNFLAYADTLAWGIPWGCGVGRIGCFLIHDHPGTLSSFVLAVKYPDGQARHDLGLYLSLVGVVIGFIFLVLDRKKRSPGFFFGAFLFLDGLSRLWFDFYRVVDVTYWHLTPTQWLSFPFLLMGAWLMWRW